MMQAPWTEIGRIESDVRDLKNQISQMVKSYEWQQVRSDVDSLERTLREVSSEFTELRYEIETLREEMRIIREEIEEN
jgi:uncharacterized protein YhaN